VSIGAFANSLGRLVDRGHEMRKFENDVRENNYLSVPSLQSRSANFLSAWHPISLRRNWPGVSISIVIALAATFVSTAYGGPQLLYALFFGLAFHFLFRDSVCQPGINFCSQTLLRTGVALLGARVTFEKITSLGAAPLIIVLLAVVSTILVGCAVAFIFGRTETEGLLSGGAVAICGASAALAISAVLPKTKENEQFTLLTVVGVTSLSTLAMIAYPLLVHFLRLDPTIAGIFIGGTIHDVAQVVGAGYLISNHTGEVATLVKLVRVACLVPTVIAVSILYRKRGSIAQTVSTPLVPFFLVGFVCMMLANSFHLIPHFASEWINGASRICLVLAIAALGVKTSLQALASLGWKPVLMLVCETVWIALLVLVAMRICM
jgi:uncharacterized integral membrane protein (TIGR00698 family)